MSNAISSRVFSYEQAGFNGAVASYIITGLADPQVSSAFYAAAQAATGKPTDSVGNSWPGGVLTNNAAGLSRINVPGSVAAAVSSIYNQAIAYQTGGPAATASQDTPSSPRTTASASQTSASTSARSTSGSSSSTSTSTTQSSSSSSISSNSTSSTSTTQSSGSTGFLPGATASSPSPTAAPESRSINPAAIAVPVVVGVLLIALGAYAIWRRRTGRSVIPGRGKRDTVLWSPGPQDAEIGTARQMEIRSVEQSPRLTLNSGGREPQAWL